MKRIYWLLIGLALALVPAVASADAYWERLR